MPTSTVWVLLNSARKRLPKVSHAVEVSPIEPEALSVEGSELVFQVTPPSVLYRPTTAQVSSAKRLSGFVGLMAMVSSALSPDCLLILTLGPTVSGAARALPAKAIAMAASSWRFRVRLMVVLD